MTATLDWDDDVTNYSRPLAPEPLAEPSPKACSIDEPDCEACQ